MANRTYVLYGSMSVGKTSQLGYLARYLYEKHHKPIRYITADGGSFEPLKPYIKAGIIKPFNLLSTNSVTYWMDKVIEGYFPKDLDEMGIPTSKEYEKGFDSCSGYAIEGISSLSDAVLMEHKGRQLSQDSSYKVRQNEGLGEVVSSAPAKSHFGFAQSKVIEWLMKSWGFPVEIVCWTAHEHIAFDKLGDAKMAGIASVGSALTPVVGKKIGTLIHLIKTEVLDAKGLPTDKMEVRCYFDTHRHVIYDKITWDAKCKLEPEAKTRLLKLHPEGYYVTSLDLETGRLDKAIDYYLRLDDKFSAGVEGGEFDKWLKGVSK